MARYRSLAAKALGLQQGQIVSVRMTQTGLEVKGVDPSLRPIVVDGVQFDASGKLRLRRGSLLQLAGVQLRTEAQI